MKLRWPTVAGLALVVAMPLLAPRLPLHDLSPTARILVGEAMFWLLALGLVAIVLLWERRPLSSIGWGAPSLRTIRRGVLGLLLYLGVALAMIGVLLLLAGDVPRFDAVGRTLQTMPAWALLLLAIRAGIVEELMTRGFALHRLAEWTGSLRIGAVLQLLLFAALHVPVWGWAKGAIVLVLGAVLTFTYLRHRDLAANMLTHVLVDSSVLLLKIVPTEG